MDEQPPQENSQELTLPIEIRHQWYNNRLYYTIVDVIGFLTQSTYPNRYWSDLKWRSAKNEGFFELYAHRVKLEIPGANNKSSMKFQELREWLSTIDAQQQSKKKGSSWLLAILFMSHWSWTGTRNTSIWQMNPATSLFFPHLLEIVERAGRLRQH